MAVEAVTGVAAAGGVLKAGRSAKNELTSAAVPDQLSQREFKMGN